MWGGVVIAHYIAMILVVRYYIFGNYDRFRGGSGGGTPHSGVPTGRSMRLGSQSSSAFALSF